MNLERIFKDIGKIGAKVLFNKQEKSSEKININQITSTDILGIRLKRLVYEGNYNKAENILFEELYKNDSQEIYQKALEFYNLLLEKSDKELEKGNFTREEIYQGLQDIKIFGDTSSMYSNDFN